MSDSVTFNNHVYVIYDSVSHDVACAFVAPNDAFAERQFLNLLSSPDATVFSLNMNDFSLCKFDAAPVKIRAASDYAESLIHSLRAERVKFADNSKEVKNEQ